jgi:IclR family acetate operon transcriptional repressor
MGGKMARPRAVATGNGGVKSALRAMEILEFLDRVRRDASIGEISAALGYPQSSTSALVQTLLTAGYLVETASRCVRPTARVAALGEWIQPAVSRRAIREAMEWLGQETRQTVVLGVMEGLRLHYIDVVPGQHPMRLEIPVGTWLPLIESGMGHLLLSTLENLQIHKLIAASRAEGNASSNSPGISEIADAWRRHPEIRTTKEVMAGIEKVRRKGFAASYERITVGAGIVCILLPGLPGDPPCGMGIGGLSSIIRDNEGDLVELLRRAVKRI